MAATRVTSQDIKDATIVDGDVAAANKDGTTATPSLRTLGAGAQQAAAGDHGHAGSTFVDNETPAGTINGVNDVFTLANTPNPAGSLHLYKNGIRQRSGAGNDFVLVTATITFEAGNIPQTGDVLLADYRY